MKSPRKFISWFCWTTVKLAATQHEGTLANYVPKMNCPLLSLHFLSKLPFQFIVHVTILGHHNLRSFRPHLLKKVRLNFANGKKKRERDQLFIWVHIGKKLFLLLKAFKKKKKKFTPRSCSVALEASWLAQVKTTEGEAHARDSLRGEKEFRDLFRTVSKLPLILSVFPAKAEERFCNHHSDSGKNKHCCLFMHDFC